MKRGKGIAAWLMVLAMVLMMTACAGGTDETAQGQTETQAAETTQAAEETEAETETEADAAAAADETVDVVIVGGGGAGMTTAIKLVEGGKDVILVEKQGMLGGATSLAATYFVAVNTPVQQEAGMGMEIADYVAEQVEANPQTSAENLTTLLEHSEESRQWLLSLGVDLTRPMSY